MHYLLKLFVVIDFKDILNEKLKFGIINLISDPKINQDELIQITF